MTNPQDKVRSSHRYSIVLADDDPIVREVLRARLSSSPDFEVIGEAEDGKSAIKQVEELHPDLLLLDLLMPNLPGIEALNELASRHVNGQTIVFSATVGPEQIIAALQAGARGVLSKSRLTDLEQAIRSVLSGNYWVEGREVANVSSLLAELSGKLEASNPSHSYGLTSREIEVIRLVTEGCSNKELAFRLNITEDTVKRHLTNIFDKVGMSTRLELALFALKNDLVRSAGNV